MSEHGGLFSLDLSSHGGNAFSKAMDVQIRTAELQGQRLAEYALPTTTFETEVSHILDLYLNSKCLSHLTGRLHVSR